MSELRCTDPRVGQLLPQYELGMLEDSERDAFLDHLAQCDFCHAELYALEPATDLLRAKREAALASKASASSARRLLWQMRLLTHLQKRRIAWAAAILIAVSVSVTTWLWLRAPEKPLEMAHIGPSEKAPPSAPKSSLSPEQIARLRSVETPTFADIFQTLDTLASANADKPNYLNAIAEIKMFTDSYMTSRGYVEEDEVDEEYVNHLSGHANYFKSTYSIYEKSNVYGWLSSLKTIYSKIKERKDEEDVSGGVAPRTIVEEIFEGDLRLICLSIGDPETIKQLTVNMVRSALSRRKREFSVKPYVLFVWDEAQEFAPALDKARGIERTCSEDVERLLRQGRKYGLGGCLVTQRIAHLNTSALQQLHTYFVGTLPRPYDRGLISNTFMVDREILERTLEFTPGEWLLSSYTATGMTNVPIFIKSEDTEQQLDKFMNTL